MAGVGDLRAPNQRHTGDGYQQTCALLELAEPPTAIFAGDYAQAAGMYRALYERDIKILDTTSLIGFDDVMYARQMAPPPTTIRRPLVEIGRMATSLLLRLIGNKSLAMTHIELSTALIVRESCAPPRFSSDNVVCSPGCTAWSVGEYSKAQGGGARRIRR